MRVFAQKAHRIRRVNSDTKNDGRAEEKNRSESHGE